MLLLLLVKVAAATAVVIVGSIARHDHHCSLASKLANQMIMNEFIKKMSFV